MCLLIASALVELQTQEHRSAAIKVVASSPLVFLCASALGLGLQVGALLVIKIAGSVTMKLLGFCRNGILVLFQASRGAENIHNYQLVGHAISMAAFVLYTLVRLNGLGFANSGSRTTGPVKRKYS